MLGFLFLSSCDSNLSKVENSISTDERLVLSQAKTKAELKSNFSKLSFEEQKTMWSNKIAQIQSRNISQRHNDLLGQLNQELQNAVGTNSLISENIKNLAIDLARITPQSDFIEMFVSLDDYKSSFDPTNFVACQYCITEIENDFNEKSAEIIRNAKTQVIPKPEPKCNCSWTCGDGPGEVTTNCRQTGGCGFLFLFTCKRYQ